MCQELIDAHVPSKMTSVRYSQILINTEIKQKRPKYLDHYASISSWHMLLKYSLGLLILVLMVLTSIKVFTASNIYDFKFIISAFLKDQNIGTTMHPSKRNVKLNVVKHITTMSAQ
jgi:hypothetical protein